LLKAIQNFDEYPKLRDLHKLIPSLTPLQLNVIIRYLERSGKIIIDSEGYIVWTHKKGHEDSPTLGEVANISDEFMDYFENYRQ